MKKKSQNQFDWVSTLLIFILFMLATSRLGLTKWAENLDVTGWLLFLGAVLGYLLGRWRVHWLVITPVSILLSGVLFPLSFILMLSQRAGFFAKILEVWTRISTTAAQLLGNQPVTDSILFLLVIGILFWLVGLATGLTMMRSGKPWIPLVLLGLGLLVIEHYQADPRRAFYTWAYAVVALILLGRLFYLKLRNEITDKNQNIGSETEFDFNRGVVITALLIGFTALLIPRLVHLFIPTSVEQTRLTQKWETFTQNFENVFYALEQGKLSQEQLIAEDFSLGTGQIQGDETVLYIQTGAKTPHNFPAYWRGKAYSTYNNKTWSLGNTYKQIYNPLQKINTKQAGEDQIEMKVWVQSFLPSLTQIYTLGESVSFNRVVSAAVATETIFDKEIMAYFIDDGIKEKEIYRFETIVSVPASEELRNVGTNYPSWVLERYLQLPDGISEKMINLSNEITANNATPFDKTIAVTQYLRSNYEYQSIIPTPAKKLDPVEWFLFDYKKGFCNYFASAEVILLRISGVPARLAVGYAAGLPGSAGDGITVQKKDSHAWPEVYFPGYGWIPFEPTSSLPTLEWNSTAQPGSENSTGNLEEQLAQSSAGLTGEDRANMLLEQLDTELESDQPLNRNLSLFGIILVIAGGLFSAIGLTYAGIKIGKNWQSFKKSVRDWEVRFRKWIYRIPLAGFWLKTIGLSPVERNYSNIEFSLRLLRIKIGPGSTAQELSTLLIEEMPAYEADILRLLTQYQLYVYSNHSPTEDEGKGIAKRIFRRSLSLWWKYKKVEFRKVFKRFS